MKRPTLIILFLSIFLMSAQVSAGYEKDIVKTSEGNLEITFFKHASLMFKFKGKYIYVDPVTKMADYSGMPKADLILITHEHQDHLDVEAQKSLFNEETQVVITEAIAEQGVGGVVLLNGETSINAELEIEAVPAYNIVHKREDGSLFHPKGVGNGYIITFADKRVYIAGDTENIPEMKKLVGIDVAFLPMNLPYTMTPEMVADAALAFKPKILYPYHFGKTDPNGLVKLLEKYPDIKVRIRKMGTE